MPRFGICPRFIGTVSILMASITAATPQNLFTAFGPVSEITIGSNVTDFFLGDFNGDRETDFGVYGPSHITLLYASGSGIVASKLLRFTDRRVEKAVSEDCNRDGRSDLFVLTADPYSIQVFVSKRDTAQLQWSEELSFVVDYIALGDINNDRKLDIVLYGKKILGLYVFLGYGNGTFKPQQFILEEYSFSQLIIHDFNSDKMMDMLGYDWVKNELFLFSGISQLKFSTPASVPLSSELYDVHYTNINGDDNLDLIIAFKDQAEAAVYLGDGFGNFREDSRVLLSFPPSKILVEDINGDRWDDIIVVSESEKIFSTYIGDGNGFSASSVQYSTGVKPVNIFAYHAGRERGVHLAVLDTHDKTLLLYHNFLYPSASDKEQRYSLGIRPNSLRVFDANKNGLPDILVTNTYSQHISLFVNRGNGTFYGQIPILTERGAESIHALWRDNSTFVCFTTHPTIDKIVMTEVTFPNFESRFTSSPAPPQVDIVSVSYDTLSRSFTLLVTSRDFSSYSLSEILWDAQRTEAVERPFFQSSNVIIDAIDVCDANNDGIRDVAFLSKDEAKTRTNLNISLGDGNGKFSPPRLVYTLPDTGIDEVRLWCVDLNNDERIDLIVQYHSDNYYLGFAYGKSGEGFFGPLEDIFPQVAVSRRSDISYTDLEGDEKRDLIVANALTKMIQVFPARGGGGFSRPKRLLSFPSDGAFAVVDFNHDQIPDYALMYSDPGMLKIFLGKK